MVSNLSLLVISGLQLIKNLLHKSISGEHMTKNTTNFRISNLKPNEIISQTIISVEHILISAGEVGFPGKPWSPPLNLIIPGTRYLRNDIRISVTAFIVLLPEGRIIRQVQNIYRSILNLG